MKHLVALMTPQVFAEETKLQKGGLLKRTSSKLNKIYKKLQTLPPKAQLQSRWSALDDIANLCADYADKMDPSGALKDPRLDAVRTLELQALSRLRGEKERANLLFTRVTAQPTQLQPGRHSPGRGVALEFTWEKAISSQERRVHGKDARLYAQMGSLGAVEFERADWKEVTANDLYALKALFKGGDWQQLQQDQAGVRTLVYMDPDMRAERRLTFFARRTIYNSQGKPADTSRSEAGGELGVSVYAASQDGDLYTIEEFNEVEHGGIYQHSSFLAGEDVMCAGTIMIRRGQLIFISNMSGHYTPRLDDLLDVCIAIKAQYDRYDLAFALYKDYQQAFGEIDGYLIPMKLFIKEEGRPPDVTDFAGGPLPRGRGWQYTHPEAAQARGGLGQVWEGIRPQGEGGLPKVTIGRR